jgi:hypothetical protein
MTSPLYSHQNILTGQNGDSYGKSGFASNSPFFLSIVIFMGLADWHANDVQWFYALPLRTMQQVEP